MCHEHLMKPAKPPLLSQGVAGSSYPIAGAKS
jgi:hypothetical protein